MYPYPGHLDFFDLSINESTGTAAVRAEFPNPGRRLLPGQFVRARIEAGTQSHGMLIPQRPVTVTPQGANVMLVNAKNVVESRPVTVGALDGGSWVVQSGLAAGDRVIVDGLQKAQPGQPVKAVAATATPAASQTGPSQPAAAPQQ